jgi:Tfp pilus assembly protein PilO
MSMKLKVILVSVLTVVVAAGWFLVSYRPTNKHLAQVRQQVVAERQQVAQLEAQLSHLQALKAHEPQLRAVLARYSAALPSDPNLPQFILQMQDAANRAGVDWLSVAPTQPSAPTAAAPGTPTTNVATGLREISVNINTTGKYFTLQNFMYRLERLDRALRVDTFTVGGGTGGQSGTAGGLTVALKLRMFMSPAPAAPAAASTTTPKAGA